ncbi:MAG: hypothetical protein ACJAVI_006133 [Candidatus Azotimanducaceae bacterium]
MGCSKVSSSKGFLKLNSGLGPNLLSGISGGRV